jgi:hypothetical protein
MPPKKKVAKKKPKVQRGGMMITPHYRQMGPYAGVQNGEGFFGDVWDGVKSVASQAGNFIKDNHLVSTALSMMPDPRAQAASRIASQFGVGEERHIRRRVQKNVLKFN